ncbi:MAG: DUF2905 domain-containing protein [Deltaproteobacteria bacterium]|jgi:uncharacterized membrane protein|nr:DUF2905 domain-containing protein [Deltaproteobacteria bacterium]MBW2504477.1 DUF2905 domain-containing protein [Deltaproteobacteria bacterium]MBW2519736.1 DUF2905 domain-containing protein [Deltaproteobacteria bacterium]
MAPDFGKTLMLTGLFLIIVGLFLTFGSKYLPLGKLPGDIHIERDNFTMFVPLGSCILISILVSLLIWLFRK